MQLSERTLDVLKNFMTVNKSIVLHPGNDIKTISETDAVYAQAVVDEYFPVEFGILDLPKFLAIMSMYKEHDISFTDDYMTIKHDHTTIKYYNIEPVLIKQPEEGVLELPEAYVSFDLSKDVLERTADMARVLKYDHIRFTGDGKKLNVSTSSDLSREERSSSHTIEIGTTKKKFNFIFEREKLNFLERDYRVVMTDDGVGHFKSSDGIEYVVGYNGKSTFE